MTVRQAFINMMQHKYVFYNKDKEKKKSTIVSLDGVNGVAKLKNGDVVQVSELRL